jgi:hypothetical protein
LFFENKGKYFLYLQVDSLYVEAVRIGSTDCVSGIKYSIPKLHIGAEPVEPEFLDPQPDFALGLGFHEVFQQLFRMIDEPEMKADEHRCQTAKYIS